VFELYIYDVILYGAFKLLCMN